MEILIPLSLFAMIAAIVIVPNWLKSRERTEMQATLRAAIDRGQEVPQEVIDAMTKNVKTAPTALSDIRAGIIWIAIGLGICVFGYFIGYIDDGEATYPMIGIGSIPIIIGLAYVVLSFFNPNKGKQS